MNELPVTAKIRKVLTEGFDDEELTCLCFDYYREVHDRFAAGMTKTAKIYALITYCEQRKKLPALVGILRIERPETYTAIFGNQPLTDPHTPVSVSHVSTTKPAAPRRIRTRINPLAPITIPEWRNEEDVCTTDFGNPAGYWCYVPPGDYAIGGWNSGEPVETISLSGFWIAKYPVTVQQYRQFMQAGGYTNQSYWTPKGWEWKQGYKSGKGRTQPYRWGEEEFCRDDQPVFGLTWYEAAAFAAWLDAELAGSATHGVRIRLLTEAEWEAAAAYDARGQRRTYPWGEQKPDAALADCGRAWNDRPASIGNHAAGAAACGAQNMGGSVWECTTSDPDKYPAASGVVMDDCNGRVAWRGGAWGNSYTVSRCSARAGIDNGTGSRGARVARLFS